MTKFKVGDVVERAGRDSSTWLDFTAEDAGPYVVTSTTVGGWIQINGYKGCGGYNTHPFEAGAFKLVEQDDPLPPAPESVRYYSNTPVNVNYLEIQIGPRSEEVCITSTCGLTTFCNYLEPDAVLQLAHDLNRMAMEIKRREKQQERKTTLSPAIVYPYGE